MFIHTLLSKLDNWKKTSEDAYKKREEQKMKDEQYSRLLREVESRVLSALGGSQDSTEKIKMEMERARDILISSGHDLEVVDNFNAKINSVIANYFVGYGG
jgi:hypothetical protein